MKRKAMRETLDKDIRVVRDEYGASLIWHEGMSVVLP